jgi:subtilase family serine protease
VPACRTRTAAAATAAVLSTLAAMQSALAALPAAAATSAPSASAPVAKSHGSPITVDPPKRDGLMHHPLVLATYLDATAANPLVTSTGPVGYAPATIKSYLGLTGTGSGQTIAVVSAYNAPTIAADLASFDSAFGLPAPASFKKVSQAGSTTSLPATDAGWALEASLDVEWAHAIAPAAAILLVEATTSSLSNLDTAVAYAAKQTGVSVISNSWGSAGELSGETTMDSYCKLTRAVCVFASGDSGNPGGYPAYNPYVISVGGTTLNLATSTTGAVTVTSEAAWSGSGGGVSIYEKKLAYQSRFTYSMRTIPDVSYDADPSTGFSVYDSTAYAGSSGWFQMGGTSAGAPQWAGIIAAADQLRKAKSKAVLAAYTSSTYPSPANTAIYALTTGLSDVASGASNGTCGSICTPGAGFDAVTGLGSPRRGIDTALAAAT